MLCGHNVICVEQLSVWFCHKYTFQWSNHLKFWTIGFFFFYARTFSLFIYWGIVHRALQSTTTKHMFYNMIYFLSQISRVHISLDWTLWWIGVWCFRLQYIFNFLPSALCGVIINKGPIWHYVHLLHVIIISYICIIISCEIRCHEHMITKRTIDNRLCGILILLDVNIALLFSVNLNNSCRL